MDEFETCAYIHQAKKFRRSSLIEAREVFESIKDYLKLIAQTKKPHNRRQQIAINLNVVDKGLTYEEKEKIYAAAKHKKTQPQCACYKLGDRCQLHSIKYEQCNDAQ